MRRTINDIRARISRGETITKEEVLALCDKAEAAHAVNLRLERALHDAIKMIEAATK
jgi:hypothetical protein